MQELLSRVRGYPTASAISATTAARDDAHTWEDCMTTLVTSKEVIGCMAHWAVRQHPFGRPDGLFDVTDALATAAASWPDGVASLPMWRVSDAGELRRWLYDTLDGHPVLTAWNTPRSGHDRPFVVSSRYFGPSPDDDFIDIDALLGNVARDVMRSAEREAAWDASREGYTELAPDAQPDTAA